MLEEGTYPIVDAIAWYRGEFLCAGTGQMTLVTKDDDSGFNSILSLQGLGSAGTCPGTPIDGALDAYRLEGAQP